MHMQDTLRGEGQEPALTRGPDPHPSLSPQFIHIQEPHLANPIAQALSACLHAKSLQSYPTLCDPMDCSPPGSSVHGILQARTLQWVAIPSSRGSS